MCIHPTEHQEARAHLEKFATIFRFWLFLCGACLLAAQGPSRQVSSPAAAVVPAALKNDIVGLWLMGQSLCDGSESLPIITNQDTGWGNYSFGRGVRTWVQGDHSARPGERPNEQFAFVPLKAAANGALGETMANGLADHLKAGLVGEGAATKAWAPHFLVAYAGQGGRMIEELAKADESADPRTPKVKLGPGGFYKTSLDDARRARETARGMGKSFDIAALVWMQGEANGGPTGGIVPGRWKEELKRPEGQVWYRDRLMEYRRQWSDDLRAITGSQSEIPMFTYQTLGPAGEAQLKAADVDPNIYLVGPHYAVPSAINSRRGGGYGAAIHLTADGERWYGEMVGKVMRRVLAEGEDWQPLRPRKAWVEGMRSLVVVEFQVPRGPLVLDRSFFPEQQSGDDAGYTSLCGFQVRDASGAVAPLKEVGLAGPDRVRLRLAKPLSAKGGCAVSYGMPYAGSLGTVKEIREGAAEGGQATGELVLTEAFPERLNALLDEGAFYISNTLAGETYAQVPVRWVRDEAGVAVLRFEKRELRNQAEFKAGQALVAARPFSYGNLRDSDDEKAVFTFADKGYGKRAGQAYPLWNWCVCFSGMRVGETAD